MALFLPRATTTRRRPATHVSRTSRGLAGARRRRASQQESSHGGGFAKSGEARKLARRKARGGLREGVAEVRVLRVAAVARPEARVDGQLHQVGETSDLLRAGRLAAGQGAELVQVDRCRAVCLQVGVDEGEVGELIV